MSEVESSWKDRKAGIVLAIFAIAGLVVAAAVAIAAGRNAWRNARLRDVCPDYFAVEYAYVVGPERHGLDSVSVEMRDNSNFNVIYRAFTDSSGRFELFNDFWSFSLHDLPFTYELHVSAGGARDTIIYKYERHRRCHFRRVEGPDTIVLEPRAARGNRLTLGGATPVAGSQACSDMPWQHTGLSPTQPAVLQGLLQGWGVVRYGVLNIGPERVAVAVVKDRLPDSAALSGAVSTGPGYLIDRNRNGQLRDEAVRYMSSPSGELCVAGTCIALDTLVNGSALLQVELRLPGFGTDADQLQYRRADALRGTVTLENRTLGALIWDRSFSSYADLRSVMVGLDLNGDGDISCAEGSREVTESAVSWLRCDSLTLSIDTISADGCTWFCSKAPRPVRVTDAMQGAWAADFATVYSRPLTLYQECAENDLVVLYFFEGSSQACMEDRGVAATLRVLRERVGSVRLIGVNRKSTTGKYTAGPVIEENLGWRGPVTATFHNFRDRELIMIDNSGTILCRGEPGRPLLARLLEALGLRDAPHSLLTFDRYIEAAPLVAESSP